MKKIILFASLIMLSVSSLAYAADDPVQKGVQGVVNTFAEGCQQELSTFCKDVVPGEGRILACLYAFQDKISSRCEYALYDSLGQLDMIVTKLTYTVTECRDDLKKYCSEVQPGEGRLLDCLNRNEANVAPRCNEALKATGYKK